VAAVSEASPLNYCVPCGQDFASVALFDRHRVGRHDGDDRRCLDVAEMIAKGWALDSRGRWSDPVASAAVSDRFRKTLQKQYSAGLTVGDDSTALPSYPGEEPAA
jgi:hypothetical protein